MIILPFVTKYVFQDEIEQILLKLDKIKGKMARREHIEETKEHIDEVKDLLHGALRGVPNFNRFDNRSSDHGSAPIREAFS